MNTHPVTIISDPAGIGGVQTRAVPDGTLLSDFLLAEFGPDGFDVPTEVFYGGIAVANRVDWTDYASVNRPVHGPVFIVQRPQGVDPYTLAIQIGIALVAAVAVTMLMPTPDLATSGDVRQARKSPNNALSGQTNIARTLERIPEIFGEVVSYPDLIAPTAFEYLDHVKFQTEYVCVGRGFYSLAEWRSGNTLISDIPGSSVVAYEPGSAPSTVLKTRQSNEVAGLLMVAPNEQVAVALDETFEVTLVGGSDHAFIFGPDGDEWDGIEVGNTVNITELYATTGGTDYDLSGTYLVNDAGFGTLELDAASAENANWSNFNGVTENVILITGSTILEPLVALPDAVSELGPFVVPGNNNDEVWIDLQNPKGLCRGTSLNQIKRVTLEFLFEEIDAGGTPTGASFVKNITLEDSTRSPRFWTYKVTSADGLVPGNRYRVTGERTNDSDPGSTTQLDETRWTRLAGIEDVAATDTSGTTRAVIEVQATEQVAAIQERQFNVRATRKVVTWNGSSVVGNISTGAGLTASRKMADALLHYFLDPKLAAQAESSLDIEALYDIQDALDAVFSGKKGEFSHTFDNQNTPALEEMRQIAVAARCFLYRQGSAFSIIRDEAQSVSRGLFNRRNKKPDAESRTVRFNRPLDHDGVSLEYVDMDDDNARTITFPDDLPASDPNFGLPDAVNPLRIEATGIRQWVQAWDRAQYEFRRQIYRRVNVESTVTAEGAMVPLNARVQHVDGTRLIALESNGEVVAVSGLNVQTSEPCDFVSGVYSVVLRDDEGNPSDPITVTERADELNGFVLSEAPPFTIKVRGDDNYQRGTLYSFGPDGNELAEAYLVQRKMPDERGNVRLEMINYAAEYYGADSTTPPEKPAL